MNREALVRILNRARDAEVTILPDSPRETPPPDAKLWDVLTPTKDPRERLASYLDALADLDETAWPEANVRALHEDIMDIFREHPEAGRWLREWRVALENECH